MLLFVPDFPCHFSPVSLSVARCCVIKRLCLARSLHLLSILHLQRIAASRIPVGRLSVAARPPRRHCYFVASRKHFNFNPPPLLSSTRTFSNAQCCNKFTNLAVRICARSVFNSLKNPAICGIPLVITSRNDKFYDYAYSDQVLLFQFPQLSDWVRFGECSFTKSTKKLIS